MITREARRVLGGIPFVRRVAQLLGHRERKKNDIPKVDFKSSPSYWEERYQRGGSSGAGSYGRLARFKAKVINRFVAKTHVADVIEFGCGDGAQLELAKYPRYVGIDVSQHVIDLCRMKFATDPTKCFYHFSEAGTADLSADLALSLDVLYHLVEDEVYDEYMRRLVASARRFICIYSSNVDEPGQVAHIRHHRFTDWMARHAPEWDLVSKTPNPFPEDPADPENTSWADFYFFRHRGLD
jgi:hypothetical protein